MPDEYRALVSSYDRLFDQTAAEKFNLSIRFDPDGLSFSVYSPEHGSIVGLESLAFADDAILENGGAAAVKYFAIVKELFRNHAVLSRNFGKVCAIFVSGRFTLIPGPLFNGRNAPEYLRFVHKVSDDSGVLVHNVAPADIRLVYSINPQLRDAVEGRFPDFIPLHHLGALLDALIPVYKRAEQPEHIFADITNKSAGIVVLRKGLPVFCNSFYCKTNEDTVYFILFIMEQLGLNPEKVPLSVLGNIVKDDALFRLISRYVRNVSLLQQSGPHTLGYALHQVETHRYYNLLNPALCG